jgi:hypothetical protein
MPCAALSVTAYESFVNAHPRHCEVLCRTNKAVHFFECHMRWRELKNLKWEVADVVNELLREDVCVLRARACCVAASLGLASVSCLARGWAIVVPRR